MSDHEETASAVELLLREPEIVAWLDEYRRRPVEDNDGGEPPQAA